MFKYLREESPSSYTVLSEFTWGTGIFTIALLAILLPVMARDHLKQLEDNNVLKFMAENGYQQKWEPNSQQLIWTKEVK